MHFGCRIFLALGAMVWALARAGAPAAPFEDSMSQRARACTACHGEQGRAGPDGYYPRLAGKPAGYLFNQLRNFRDGRRHYALMQNLIDPLDDAFLQALADHFSAQHVPYPAPTRARANAETLERGRRLVQEGRIDEGLPACVACHGDALMGVNPATPGLLGLPADYLNAQLGGWQIGQRRTTAPDCMAEVARRLSADDISAISQWLSSQTVATQAAPAQPGTAKRLSPAWRCASAP